MDRRFSALSAHAICFAFIVCTALGCKETNASGPIGKDPVPAASSVASKEELALPGVDISTLTPRERKEWSAYVGEFAAPCADVKTTIAVCIREKKNCSRCLPAAKLIMKSVRDGLAKEQVEKLYKARFDSGAIKNVPLDGSPTKGPDSAAITIIEFADFECPYCGVMAPMLNKLYDEQRGKIRVIYKFMPLPGHPHGEIAARAAIAAASQGKFWEMHKKLFENQKRLEQSDLDGYAKDIGLDFNKYKADLTSAATTDRLQRDRKLADSSGVQGTPTLFINGRDFELGQDLNEWIAMELGTDAAGPPTAPAAPERNGPTAPAAPERNGPTAPAAPERNGPTAPSASANPTVKGK